MGTGNKENLGNFADLTAEERRALASKAGKASVESRRRKKSMREALEYLLYHGEVPESTKTILRGEGVNDDEMTHQMVITRSLIAKAEAGDVQAYNAICAMIGEKPAENMNIGGIPTNLVITYRGTEADKQFPSSEAELDLDRPEGTL